MVDLWRSEGVYDPGVPSAVLIMCSDTTTTDISETKIVNIQAMIDTHERWLDQEEEYMQEQMAFYKSFRGYSTSSAPSL